MAKKAYIGVDGIARKIRKGYVGVDGVARKIKKAYIGIGGVARPCWGAGEVTYYGPITSLRDYRYYLTATTLVNVAFFGGGYRSGNAMEPSGDLDAYDLSLTRIYSGTPLKPRSYLASTSVTAGVGEEYAFFGGGGTESENYNTVEVFDIGVTKISDMTLSLARRRLSAASTEQYAIFAGGLTGSPKSNAEAFYYDLTQVETRGLSQARCDLAATTVGSYALFGGGCKDTANAEYSAVVDCFNRDLTLSQPEKGLLTSRGCLSATTLDNYAIFAGGSGGGASNVVDVYDDNLVRTNYQLSTKRYFLAATSVREYALFGGGRNPNFQDTLDIFDKSFTRTSQSMPKVVAYHAATSVEGYALFAGGKRSDASTLKDVEVYTV